MARKCGQNHFYNYIGEFPSVIVTTKEITAVHENWFENNSIQDSYNDIII